MNVIATWMYSSPKGEKILHHQVGRNSGTKRIQNYYWRCVFLLFESSNRLNSDCRHLLFVNKMPPASIDGIDTKSLLQQYLIEVVELPTITLTSPDYYSAWNTQFIVLDILDWLKDNCADDDSVIVLDSDVIFHRPISKELEQEAEKHKALLYTINYPVDYKINGLTRNEMLRIAQEIEPGFSGNDFSYSGGEFIIFRGSEAKKIADCARRYFRICLQRHEKGQPKFNEEAQLLSFVYHVLGYKTRTANKYIRRIWTDRSIFSNVDGTEDGLILWHLPAEKTNGFLKVFRSYRKINGNYVLTAKNFSESYRLQERLSDKLLCYVKKIIRTLTGR